MGDGRVTAATGLTGPRQELRGKHGFEAVAALTPSAWPLGVVYHDQLTIHVSGALGP